MQKYGTPDKIVRMVKVFYEDFNCAVKGQAEACQRFNIKTGVKQGRNMSGFLFLIAMDWIMRRTVGKGENGIRWNFSSKLDDLDFADDVALLCSTKQHIQNKTTKMNEEARRVGLKINKGKTKVMRINGKSHEKVVMSPQSVFLPPLTTAHWLPLHIAFAMLLILGLVPKNRLFTGEFSFKYYLQVFTWKLSVFAD